MSSRTVKHFVQDFIIIIKET